MQTTMIRMMLKTKAGITMYDNRYSDSAIRFEIGKKSMLAAYVMWFLLGYGGVHRIYLGRTSSGMAMAGLFLLCIFLVFALVPTLGTSLVLVIPVGLTLSFWHLLDIVLIPGMVEESNTELADTLYASSRRRMPFEAGMPVYDAQRHGPYASEPPMYPAHVSSVGNNRVGQIRLTARDRI